MTICETARETTGDPRWTAVVARDRSADGTFCYAVRTTGIYCRPSCPARRARPENVEFYAGSAAAEAAGFRPCKRCRPELCASGHPQARLVASACRAIESAENAPPLAVLARKAGLSPPYFHRLFKSMTGLTPRGYAAAHRGRRLRDSLPGAERVVDAVYDAGFGSGSRFYAQADAMLGMTPRNYRAGGKGEVIRFARGDSSLGVLLVAATGKGVCAIFLGDDPEALVRDLQDRFPAARLVGGDPDFSALVAQVAQFVDMPRLGFDLPLDVRGTAFQQRVWQVLTTLPPGATASYAEIAQALGAPSAVRAVARACGANALAVAIPCHRVVRADGALAGYRWGVERKRALLDREAEQAKDTQRSAQRGSGGRSTGPGSRTSSGDAVRSCVPASGMLDYRPADRGGSHGQPESDVERRERDRRD
ncbi:bifunctional DNA-binding transcriptional regulator/O6-methylguanine-DNA methyltransferase Ada [Acidomonas methanolica]|uniref:bifunctional DNA-binding transcriptional regulator/O6-methylguanine-DNA methyltransferase Ada n=1 Tax=Acidomonas methanolica TaxID=437 RepID=UPI00277B562C|nr:bifunctional DNA-binding transcriptional regulator/O6-methylguanine-DNA methyltransferase Ada [Acidomonas methanolica]MCQ9155765.1 bifunctional DNA-binding transcriptional regulator/O6-methylguanine-DNA methyltransferase Ada [Acidomonas methanolica]